jgi:threonine dehydratase
VRDIRQFVDEVVLVSEEQMIDAIRHLYERENVLAEPAGAAATAAFLASSHQEGLTVLLVSGANISGEVKQRAGIG